MVLWEEIFVLPASTKPSCTTTLLLRPSGRSYRIATPCDGWSSRLPELAGRYARATLVSPRPLPCTRLVRVVRNRDSGQELVNQRTDERAHVSRNMA